ncbi:hypothetical protein B566_EDAN015161 [Ephemera danica]|nr:hypothetical protein B566_EDAN015161 [Ephemera danica]
MSASSLAASGLGFGVSCVFMGWPVRQLLANTPLPNCCSDFFSQTLALKYNQVLFTAWSTRFCFAEVIVEPFKDEAYLFLPIT